MLAYNLLNNSAIFLEFQKKRDSNDELFLPHKSPIHTVISQDDGRFPESIRSLFYRWRYTARTLQCSMPETSRTTRYAYVRSSSNSVHAMINVPKTVWTADQTTCPPPRVPFLLCGRCALEQKLYKKQFLKNSLIFFLVFILSF